MRTLLAFGVLVLLHSLIEPTAPCVLNIAGYSFNFGDLHKPATPICLSATVYMPDITSTVLFTNAITGIFRSFSLEHDGSVFNISLCPDGLPEPCPSSGNTTSQCNEPHSAAVCKLAENNQTTCLGKVPKTRVRSFNYNGTIDGVEFTFTEGDSEYTTQAAVTCDKNAHQLTNVYIESNTTNMLIKFAHKAACPITSITKLHDCFDAGVAGAICLQLNTTQCLYASLSMTRNEEIILDRYIIGIPGAFQRLQKLKPSQIGAFPLTECFNLERLPVSICYIVDNITQTNISGINNTLTACTLVQIRLVDKVLKTIPLECISIEDCPLISCGEAACNNHGTCGVLGCVCDAGYFGPYCDIYSADKHCATIGADTYCIDTSLDPSCENIDIYVHNKAGTLSLNQSVPLLNVSGQHLFCVDGVISNECSGCFYLDEFELQSNRVLEGCYKMALRCLGNDIASYEVGCGPIVGLDLPTCEGLLPALNEPELPPQSNETQETPRAAPLSYHPSSIFVPEEEGYSVEFQYTSKWLIIIGVIVLVALTTIFVYIILRKWKTPQPYVNFSDNELDELDENVQDDSMNVNFGDTDSSRETGEELRVRRV